MAYRYALYWAPPRDHPLWLAGCAWLGRDPETGETFDAKPEPLVTREEHARLVADSSRYGWHATLKAPFRLADGRTYAELDTALREFAARRSPFPSPPLVVASLAGFLAVVTTAPSAALSALADDAVRAFDHFRAPPSAQDLAKRLRNGLTARQREMLETWGYPYVIEEWRFHMTLTARLGEERVATLRPALAERFAPALLAPPLFREVALYVEPEPGAPFRLLRRYPFRGA